MGGQHSHANEVLPVDVGPVTFQVPVVLSGSNWAMGGTLTERLDGTVILFTAQHQVTNGGGLLGAAVSTSVGGSVGAARALGRSLERELRKRPVASDRGHRQAVITVCPRHLAWTAALGQSQFALGVRLSQSTRKWASNFDR